MVTPYTLFCYYYDYYYLHTRTVNITGITELSIPSVEPLIVPEVVINQGKGSAMNLQAVYRDLHLWGISQFELKDFQ